MILDSNNHSVFLLNYHLVLVVKYRKKAIDERIAAFLRDKLESIAPAYGVTVLEWGWEADHVHALFKARPNTELSKFINAYKAASSRLVQRMFPEVKEILWGGSFWTKSYCLLTTGGATLDVVRAYVEGQGVRGR